MKKRRTKISWRLLTDAESRYWLKNWKRSGPTAQHASNSDFPRVYNRRSYVKAQEFEEAGYPMAVLRSNENWQEVHRWCAEQFRNERGVTYTWTGEKFWFQTEADRDKFVERWS